MSWLAKFPGLCPGCGHGIELGQWIDRANGVGVEVYVHEGCSVPLRPEPKVGEVCGRCFMERSLTGECGCDE